MSDSSPRSELSESLDGVIRCLEGLGRYHLLRLLKPGLPPSVVQKLLSSLELPAPTRLVGLYSWRDGTLVEGARILDDIHFFPGYYFLSLEDALEQAETLRSDTRWQEGWLPIFANGGGDYYAADLARADAMDAPVIRVRFDDPDEEFVFETIAAMVTNLGERCQDAFYVDARGYLETDRDITE